MASSRFRELERHAPWLVLFAAIVIALAVRLPEIKQFTAYGDEGVAWRLTENTLAELIAKRDNHVPPLYFVLLRGWTAVLGTSLFAFRLFSVLCSIATMLAVFGFARDVFADRSGDVASQRRALWIGAVAALFIATSTTQHMYAEYTRVYSLALLLGTLVPWTMWRALHAPPGTALRRWGLWAVLSASLFYTQNLGMFTVFGQAAIAFGLLVYRARGDLRALVQMPSMRHLALASLGFVVLLAPWVPTMLTQHENPAFHSFYMMPLTLPMALRSFTLLLWPTPFYRADMLLLWGLTLGLVAVYVAVIVRRRFAGLFTVVAALVPFLAAAGVNLTGGPSIVDRYMLWSHPFMVLAIAVVLVDLVPRYIAAPLVAVGIAYQMWFWSGFAAKHLEGRPGAAGIATYLEKLPVEGTAIVVMPDEYFNVLYHAREQVGRDFRMFIPAHSEKAYGFVDYLNPGEPRIRAAAIDSLDTPRLVTIDQEGVDDPIPTSPKGWKLVDSRGFAGPFYPTPLVVNTYERSPGGS
jgi:mannosyltransferase